MKCAQRFARRNRSTSLDLLIPGYARLKRLRTDRRRRCRDLRPQSATAVGKRRVATVSVDRRGASRCTGARRTGRSRAHLASRQLDSDPRRDRPFGMLAALEDNQTLTRRDARSRSRAARYRLPGGAPAKLNGERSLTGCDSGRGARPSGSRLLELQFNIAAALADAKHDEALGGQRAVGDAGRRSSLLLWVPTIRGGWRSTPAKLWAGARAIEPDNVDAWAGTGRVLRDGGHFGAAGRRFALRRVPQLDLAWQLFLTRRRRTLTHSEGRLCEQPGHGTY